MTRPLRLALIGLALGLAFAGYHASVQAQDSAPPSGDLAALGKALFFDSNLSINSTQSCAACHAPEAGFTGPDSAVNAAGAVYQGALPNHFGNRRPPAAAYAGDSPALHFDQGEGAWLGGMFWDGRATGTVLGDPLAEQAQGPFLNPLEQALPNAQVLCVKVMKAAYAALFEQVWGAGSLDCARDADGVYERVARSIAAYERSAEVSAFTSKFDLFWDKTRAAGKDVTKIRLGMGGGMMGGGGSSTDPYRWQNYRGLGLTDAELQGLAAFNDPNRANCAACHSLQPGSAGYPLFTDFGYANLGLPKNPDNPFYAMPPKWNPDGEAWVDYGLGGYLKNAGYPAEVYGSELGKFKVPTLRNVDRRPSGDAVKAYGHNGYFKSLDEVVLFYAWQGMMQGGCMGGGGMGGGGMGCGGMGSDLFPAPEVDQNLATLNMVPTMDRANIVAFLRALSDGYFER